MGAELGRALAMYDDLVRAMANRGLGGGIAALRRCYDAWFAQFPVPDDAEVVAVDAAGVGALRVKVPGVSEGGVILHFHSGGYVLGSAHAYRAMGAALSRASGSTVVLVDYRLAPEHPFPAALDDAMAAYRWVRDSGTPSKAIVLCGDSAGGGLVVAALLRLRDEGAPLPAACVSISPFADLALTGDSLLTNRRRDPVCQREALAYFAGLYLGGAEARSPWASPLYGNLADLPPLLVLAGEAEALRDDAVRLAGRARSAGTTVSLDVVDEMPHIFPVFSSFLPEAGLAVSTIGRFVREHTAR